MNSLIKPQLGTATISTANYVDWYGLPRNIFPCASRCESKSCSATMFDSIQNITREATEGCRAVVYYGNFSVDFEDLGTHEGQVGASRLICRVIFVSKKSRLVATITRQVKMSQLQFASSNETNTSDESLLVMINGIRYGDWNIVWVDRDETTISELDLALMVIDPSAIFAKSVDRAMYTESLSMMRADVKHLLQILKKIALVAFPAQTIRQRIGSTKGIQSVAVSAQNSRRAIFYAEAAMEEYSLESYLHVTGSTAISDKQKTFYKQSTDIIMSTEGRTKAEIHSSPFTSFPFQWTSTAFHMHDTTMSHSQDFRCDWLKESLTWGGGRDVMSLSWAYTIGKYLAEGTIQPPPSTDTHPINTDRSWFPLVRNSGTNTRVMNRRADEIFVRILPEKTASGRTNLRWQDILISTV